DPDWVRAAEAEFAECLELPNPILVRSAAEGFLNLLCALELGPGDEVVLPVSMCQTMVNAVWLAQAVPVLADCDAYLGIDIDDLHRRLSPATRVVVMHHP